MNNSTSTPLEASLLIVDDEEHIVNITKFFMQDKVTKIFTAANGKEALSIIEKEKIHCVVSDIRMPIMTGLELIQEVRAKKMNIPFIFYSAYSDDGNLREALNYGAFDFISKPALDDLCIIVLRGVQEGLKQIDGKKVSSENTATTISDYQKLLQRREQIKLR